MIYDLPWFTIILTFYYQIDISNNNPQNGVDKLGLIHYYTCSAAVVVVFFFFFFSFLGLPNYFFLYVSPSLHNITHPFMAP